MVEEGERDEGGEVGGSGEEEEEEEAVGPRSFSGRLSSIFATRQEATKWTENSKKSMWIDKNSLFNLVGGRGKGCWGHIACMVLLQSTTTTCAPPVVATWRDMNKAHFHH